MLQLQTLPRIFHSHLTISKFQFLNFVFCFLFSATYFLCSPFAAAAGTATIVVGWDASTGSVAGYEICYGTSSGKYDHVVDVGNNTSCSISGLVEETTYYLAVKSYDSEGNKSAYSEELVHTVESAITNNAPTVSITSPAIGASFDSGAIISFDGAASDNEDGDLTDDMVWTTELHGQIATGGSFTTLLSDGTHTITAEVTDTGGSTCSDSITITVGGGDDTTITLTATGKQNKRWYFINLDWSGATSTDVDIYRDSSYLTAKSNDGAFTDKISNDGSGGPITYQVCEAGTLTCSVAVPVNW